MYKLPTRCRMNRFLSEMHLKQPKFTNNVHGPLLKRKKQYKQIKEAEDSRYIYQNKIKHTFNMIWIAGLT